MPHWAHGQHVYNRYSGYSMSGNGYPNTTAGGSPLDHYGGYYTPASYSASSSHHAPSSGSNYRGGYPAVSSYGNAQSITAAANPSYSQYATASSSYDTSRPGFPASAAGYNNHSSASYAPSVITGASSGYGNGSPVMTGAAHNTGHDPTLLAAMHNLSFGNK